MHEPYLFIAINFTYIILAQSIDMKRYIPKGAGMLEHSSTSCDFVCLHRYIEHF